MKTLIYISICATLIIMLFVVWWSFTLIKFIDEGLIAHELGVDSVQVSQVLESDK